MSNFTRLEIYEGPNKSGEYHYALFWMADYHPGHPEGEYGWRERGQHFLAPLKPEFDKLPTKDLRHQR
jgi:hypothetical protein